MGREEMQGTVKSVNKGMKARERLTADKRET